MKPVSIRFRCFGPYMDEQFLDFSRLEQSGLFLICGETGAGKTTILDAMCYALYGRSSGGLRGDLSVMRCKLAGKSDETLVDFIFDCGGKRYQFIRSLKYGRKNLNDTHNCLVWEDGVFVPIFENPKATFVNQKAQALIGLTYEQFRQVIILPQGQFEKLLVSNSEEKEKILVSLFHADRWQRIAEELSRRVTEQDNALKQEKLQIAAKLRDYGCRDLEELAGRTSQLRTDLEALTEQAQAAAQAVAEEKTRYEQTLLLDREFSELQRRQQRLAALQSQAGIQEQAAQQLELADLAEQLRPQHQGWETARSQQQRAHRLLLAAEGDLTAARKALAAAEQRRDAHEAARPAQEQRKQQKLLLERAVPLYRSLGEKQQAAQAAAAALHAAQTAQVQAEARFADSDAAWRTGLQTQARSMEAYQAAQQLYLQGIGSTLAQGLQPHTPCPVCGSRDHPAPAQPTAQHMTEVQLDRYNRQMLQAGKAVSAALDRRNREEAAKNQALAACSLAAQHHSAVQTDYEIALGQKLPGIGDLSQLQQRQDRLQREIAAFEAAELAVVQALEQVQQAHMAAAAAVRQAREAAVQADAACAEQAGLWQEALAASGLGSEQQFRACCLPPEEIRRRRTALIQFRTELAGAQNALAEQQEKLKGQQQPDLPGGKQRLQATEATCDVCSRQLALTARQLETMEQDAAGLARRSRRHDQQRSTVDADLEFANRLRGRSGVSLQRYVLGVMLTSITAEANRLLRRVYGGRYQLYRTDEIAGSARKGGLELEVLDRSNSERRSVTTLSGGEKFLVALSLAIGLSTVVQAQGGGIRLEAMFIDEGFGSLDRDAIHDALEVLVGIQRSSGIVGIISHVEQLAEVIPTKIEIRKGRRGSRCVIHD